MNFLKLCIFAYYHMEMCILFWKVDRTSFESAIGLFKYAQNKRPKKDIFRASYTLYIIEEYLKRHVFVPKTTFNFLYFYIVITVRLHESQIYKLSPNTNNKES